MEFFELDFRESKKRPGRSTEGSSKAGKGDRYGIFEWCRELFLDLGGMVERGGVAVDGGFPAQIV